MTINPELDTDVTWQCFVQHPPPNAVVRKIGWQDNPWFPQVLIDEKAALERRDPDSALVVWEGHTRQVLDGAIYANEIRAATKDSRITRVPYDASKPVHTFWDLGCAAKQLGTGRSVEEMLRASGRTVKIAPQLSVEDGVNAARSTGSSPRYLLNRPAISSMRLRLTRCIAVQLPLKPVAVEIAVRHTASTSTPASRASLTRLAGSSTETSSTTFSSAGPVSAFILLPLIPQDHLCRGWD